MAPPPLVLIEFQNETEMNEKPLFFRLQSLFT